MTDLGSFAVQSEALRAAAELWRGGATDAGAVKSDLYGPAGMGNMFGVLAGSCGVSGHYNTWSWQMHTAAETAQTNFRYLDAALVSAANAYDGADSTVATNMNVLDGMI